MAEPDSFRSLLEARDFLKKSLDQSRDISVSIDQTGRKLEDIRQKIPPLEAAVKSTAGKCSSYANCRRLHRAAAPFAATVAVSGTVRQLETQLDSIDISSDLFGYLSVVHRLRQAEELLAGICHLAALWIDDTVKFLEENELADDHQLLNLKKILKEFSALEKGKQFSLAGKVLDSVENEFRHLLSDHHAFPVNKLQAIVETLTDYNRPDRCSSIYIEARRSKARTTIQALDLGYLDSKSDDHDQIDRWAVDLGFIMRELLQTEYELAIHLFGPGLGLDIFAAIAIESKIESFIEFGKTVANGKNEAVKLLKLLEIFQTLNELRTDFNRFFGNIKTFPEIQSQIRDLITKVVNGVSGIFQELKFQVESHRFSNPPKDGNVPQLITSVTDFLNQLLEENNKSTLTQVLKIQKTWKNEEFEDEFVPNEIQTVVRLLEQNVETWAKRYQQTNISYIFMMNSHCYFHKNLKNTNLGNLMGKSWLQFHEQITEKYTDFYIKESWAKFTVLLRSEGPDSTKKKLEAFVDEFDEIYKKQSKWVVSDKGLRLKTCQLIVKEIVPVYVDFVRNYVPLVEQGSLKHSENSLEIMISSMFQPKIGKYSNSGSKCNHLIKKIKHVVANHLTSTPAAT